MAERQRLGLYGGRDALAYGALGLKPLTTRVRSPQSNGMAESFVKTMKRDYIAIMPKPDAATAARNLAIAFDALQRKASP
ncbi:hypothetical protein BGC_20000 [Burkholderia sp. 3C]